MIDHEFLAKIPKTDLHLHLDGAVRIKTIIDLAKELNVELPSYDEKELEAIVFPPKYESLEEYLKCFAVTGSVMRDFNALQRIAYEVACDQFDIGVRYFEVRFAPQLHAVPKKLSLSQVLEAVNMGLKKACDQYNSKITSHLEPEYGFGIIVCGMRYFEPEFSPWYKDFWSFHKHEEPKRIYGMASKVLVGFAKEARDMGTLIVGIDIAGAENGYPASYHQEAFGLAQKYFLKKTVHSGEAFGPPSIYQAITDLHAERIGHGFHLFNLNTSFDENMDYMSRAEYVERLTDFIADKRICIEVCLTSNLQTIPELNGDLSLHPFKQMLDRKLSVSICSDNPTVSHTTVLNELKLACDTFNLTHKQLKDIIVTGFKRSFMPTIYSKKREYIRKVINYYESLAKEYNIS